MLIVAFGRSTIDLNRFRRACGSAALLVAALLCAGCGDGRVAPANDRAASTALVRGGSLKVARWNSTPVRAVSQWRYFVLCPCRQK